MVQSCKSRDDKDQKHHPNLYKLCACLYREDPESMSLCTSTDTPKRSTRA